MPMIGCSLRQVFLLHFVISWSCLSIKFLRSKSFRLAPCSINCRWCQWLVAVKPNFTIPLSDWVHVTVNQILSPQPIIRFGGRWAGLCDVTTEAFSCLFANMINLALGTCLHYVVFSSLLAMKPLRLWVPLQSLGGRRCPYGAAGLRYDAAAGLLAVCVALQFNLFTPSVMFISWRWRPGGHSKLNDCQKHRLHL